MRRILIVASSVLAFGLGLAGPAFADNPPGPPGPPSQSCQDLEPNTPGNAANSPGSPFNEPGINSPNGGIGGQNYSEKSQYDVACFQQARGCCYFRHRPLRDWLTSRMTCFGKPNIWQHRSRRAERPDFVLRQAAACPGRPL